jgi:Mn2+/Fe2+ NRAMP family transporter
MFADFMRLQGAFRKDDYKARTRWRDIFIVILLVIPVVLFLIFGEAPVQMVTWGAVAQALMLPVISLGTVYLVQRHLPPELQAPRWMTGLLWAAAIVTTLFVIPALFMELAKLMK